jgi:hypothetical protein
MHNSNQQTVEQPTEKKKKKTEKQKRKAEH